MMTINGLANNFGISNEGFTPIIDMELRNGTWEKVENVKQSADEILEGKINSGIGNENDYAWFYGLFGKQQKKD